MTRNRTIIRTPVPTYRPFTFGRLNTQRPGRIHMAIHGVKACPTKGNAPITDPTTTGEITAATACRRCFTAENLTLAGLENTMGPTMNITVARLLDRIGETVSPREASPVPQPTPDEVEARLIAEEAADRARRAANRTTLAAFLAAVPVAA